MRRRALRVLLAAVLGAVTFVLLGMFGGFVYASAESTASTAQYQYGSDTAVVGTPLAPSCLNPLRTPCVTTQTWAAGGIALEGAFRIRPDLTYEPMLVESVDVQTPKKNLPFALTYHIRPEAVWSDEVPVSADDFVFTYEVIVDPANDIGDRTGYELIAEATAVDAKTVRFVFEEPFAGWRTLFAAVLPKHVLEGHDFDQVWANEIADPDTHEPIGSGPFLVTGFTGGFPGWLTLSLNAHWWGPQTPSLEAVAVRFANPNELIQGIQDGEIDAVYNIVGPEFEVLVGQPGIVTRATPGPATEHLDFNLGSTTMPLLAHDWFREAVARSIDRAALASSASTATPDLEPLDNLLYLSQQTEYEPHFDQYDYRPSKVAALMSGHGCTLGNDDIWSCDGTRASIEFATTTGNPRRGAAQTQMQAQADAAGIELVPDNSPPNVLFGTRLPARDYELMMFAWVFGLDPSSWDTVYGCAGTSNHKAYCSPALDDLLAQSESELDEKKRAKLVNKADRHLADDVPTIPLYQIPSFLAHRTALHGVSDNLSVSDGPTWNIEEWSKD